MVRKKALDESSTLSLAEFCDLCISSDGFAKLLARRKLARDAQNLPIPDWPPPRESELPGGVEVAEEATVVVEGGQGQGHHHQRDLSVPVPPSQPPPPSYPPPRSAQDLLSQMKELDALIQEFESAHNVNTHPWTPANAGSGKSSTVAGRAAFERQSAWHAARRLGPKNVRVEETGKELRFERYRKLMMRLRVKRKELEQEFGIKDWRQGARELHQKRSESLAKLRAAEREQGGKDVQQEENKRKDTAFAPAIESFTSNRHGARKKPQPMSEAKRRALAHRKRLALLEAQGGAQLPDWISRPIPRERVAATPVVSIDLQTVMSPTQGHVVGRTRLAPESATTAGSKVMSRPGPISDVMLAARTPLEGGGQGERGQVRSRRSARRQSNAQILAQAQALVKKQVDAEERARAEQQALALSEQRAQAQAYYAQLQQAHDHPSFQHHLYREQHEQFQQLRRDGGGRLDLGGNVVSSLVRRVGWLPISRLLVCYRCEEKEVGRDALAEADSLFLSLFLVLLPGPATPPNDGAAAGTGSRSSTAPGTRTGKGPGRGTCRAKGRRDARPGATRRPAERRGGARKEGESRIELGKVRLSRLFRAAAKRGARGG